MAPHKDGGNIRPSIIKNKLKRSEVYIRQKKAAQAAKRDLQFRRKREEDKNPRLRVVRRAKRVPKTLESKRVWDDADLEDGDGLGLAVDVERLKRRKTDHTSHDGSGLTESKLKEVERQTTGDDEPNEDLEVSEASNEDDDGDAAETPGKQDKEDDAENSPEDDLASLMDDSEADDQDGSDQDEDSKLMPPPRKPPRAQSPVESNAPSTTSTNMSLIPEALAAKFPTLFNPPETPKVLVTTSLNSMLHEQAYVLTTLFPNSTYIPRKRHRHNAHQFSLREIAKFASNREFTTLMVLEEDSKRPSGLTLIHLPAGPTLHFTIRNWVEGQKLPGHGAPTNHYPELVLNNFRTPLGLLTAHVFRTLFPPQPEIQGRQVVTLHNQRDYIFVRRHRYIFRDKRDTEKTVVDATGKPMKGAEEIRAGLQELGPRFTLKLRRIDKGLQWASGQEWTWKARMEKQRTKFQL